MTKITYIPGEIANAAIDEHGNRKPVTRTHHIFDDNLEKPQSEVNQDRIEDVATLDGKIALEKQRAEGVESGLNNRLGTVEQLAEISIGGGDAQIATGADFTNPDATKRAKVPTVGAIVDGLNDGVYDVSKRNPSGGPNSDGKFTLEYVLNNADTLIPTGWRHGGMTISFVQTSDNKYVQFRCMAPDFTTDVIKWQGVDNVVEAGSISLVEGGAIIEEISKFADYTKTAITPYSTSDNYALTGNGNRVSDNTSRLKRYNVTAGNVLYLNLSKDNGGVYQFQTDASVPSEGTNSHLIGKPITNYSKGFVTVPTGATWLIVSELKTNSTNYVGIYHKPASLNLALKSCVGGRIVGKKLGTAEGTTAEDTTKYVVPYIKVNPGDVVVRSGSDYLYTYNSSFVKNDYYSGNPVTIPSDAVYMRTSLPVDGTGYIEINGVRVWDDTIELQKSTPADMESTIRGWILGECMTVSGLSKNADGAITQVRGYWPDGSYGNMTITRNSDNLATQVVAVWLGTSYTLTITRDSDGNVTETIFV